MRYQKLALAFSSPEVHMEEVEECVSGLQKGAPLPSSSRYLAPPECTPFEQVKQFTPSSTERRYDMAGNVDVVVAVRILEKKTYIKHPRGNDRS